MTLGIVGMGAMGRGIAEAGILSGVPVVLVKSTPGSIDGPRRAIAESLDRARRKGRLDTPALDAAVARLTLTNDLRAVRRCGVVIESIVEDAGAKRTLYAALEAQVGATTVLATNTSSLPLAVLASSLRRPERFLGLHFFSPVAAMKLVELATTPASDPAAVERALELCAQLGKEPIVVDAKPGYIVNRLLVPYLLDGIAALEAQVAPARAIDAAMRLGCGHPMGPLELADAIGLDVVHAMAKILHRELRDQRYSPPALLRRLVSLGHLGKKRGLGIYDHSRRPPEENPALWPAGPQLETAS